MVEKACFLSETIGFLKAGSWRTSYSSGSPWSGRVHAVAAAGGGAPPRRVRGEDHMQGWVQLGIKEAIVQKRYLASLIVIDDCDAAVGRCVLSLPL